MWPTQWPASARAIATGIDSALTAARATDAAGFDAAMTDLAALAPDQVEAVQAAIVRELLEIAHPDGLSGDDVRAVLEAVVHRSAAWLPRIDVPAMISVLTGALNVQEPDDADRSWTDPRPAAMLLIEYLAQLSGTAPTASIRRAIDEIARAETVEMP
ncbi:hypothetical protein ACFO5K_18565 [Nocardia halotolerans]|uniref:Uncharacterized protein n=1 Tax=Nocardia halotolerans TaxID=1755878 RepID=A0ABV8VL67_9NOCA